MNVHCGKKNLALPNAFQIWQSLIKTCDHLTKSLIMMIGFRKRWTLFEENAKWRARPFHMHG